MESYKILVVLVFLINLHGLCTAQRPRLEFFERTGCQGLTDTIYNYNSTLGDIDHIANATTFGVFGLWQYQQTNFPWTQTTYHYAFDATQRVKCEEKYQPDSQFMRALRYGSNNQRDPAMSVFTDRTFGGIEYSLIGTSNNLTLPRTFRMRSWFTTGNHNYTIYENPNMTGSTYCLRPNESLLNFDDVGGWGMSYNWGSRLNVGAIKYGCSDEGGGSTTTTTAPGGNGSAKVSLSIAILLSAIFKFVICQ